MEENKNTFGDTVINGKRINLDTATVQELEECIKEVKEMEKNTIVTLNKIVDEIENS